MFKKIKILGLFCLTLSSTNLYADESAFAGSYIGGHLSRVGASMTQEDSDCFYNCSAYTQVNDSPGFGVQGGFNVVRDNLLMGIELNYTDTAGEGKEDFEAGYYNTPPPQDMKYTSELKGLMSLRFRAGLVLNNTAIILSAGPALGDFDHEFRDQNNSANDQSNDDVASYSDETSGWVTGVAIEHAFTNKVIASASYSQYTFDDEQSTVIDDSGIDDGYIVKYIDTVDTFDISVSYKF
ncbi:MAG: outer membrane beta-barrel protein [Pseudomonadales bacterium]|nr:outer membrane beta-barrel protein [Pseudomonadales bacterium]